ncbi:hypothetical protein K7X08_005625 [Anisodus acutangulus]|uniref:C2H2-type domain-containing protein n=1 Tax=Anisodus acutangulus TaxID=402998 RepID=A0A9Q1LRB6_9SOLA|nr:hypothetical protein K7X08_005625 [Anisodus acutangulus]
MLYANLRSRINGSFLVSFQLVQCYFDLIFVCTPDAMTAPDAMKAPDVMKMDEVNESFDVVIRQAMGKEPLLSLPRTGESPVQWIQWLHSIEQPDGAGWSLSNPSQLQMQKCEKCSREFCSPINHKRHIRLHRKSSNSDKESRKHRDLLGEFWDKLSLDEVKEVVSLQDISLKEIAGSALIHALSTALGQPGVWSLPCGYVKAGSMLLKVIQAKPSSLPVSSKELFSILDDASERTFLCAGTAESVEKYVFDGEAKICFDSKNLIACTSFLFEQKLVKAWAADKDAEALKCQKLIFEEEEAAQKKQAELSKKKKVKKLRQKEQKAREQSNEEKGNLEVPADCFEVPLAEADILPGPSDSNSNNPDVSLDVSTSLELVQLSTNEDMRVESQYNLSHQHLNSVKVQNFEPQLQSNEEKGNLEVPPDCFEVPSAETDSLLGPSDSNSNDPDVSLDVSISLELVQLSSNEDMSVKSQYDLSNQHLDSVNNQTVEPQPVSANSRRRSANAERQAPKSQKSRRKGNNQNHQTKVEPLQKHKDSGSPANSSKIWTRKVRVESDDASILEVQKEAIDLKHRNSEVMIGSISIPVKDCSTDQQQGNCPAEARDDFGSTEPAMTKKCNIVEKPAKHNALQIGSNKAAAKLWRPVRHEVGRKDPEEGVMSSKFDDLTSLNENPLQSCPVDSSDSSKNCQVPDGNADQGLGFSSVAGKAFIAQAKAFLAQRWREALAGDHVTLVLASDTESSGRPDVSSSSSEAAPASDSGEHSVVSTADDQLAKNEVLNSSSSRTTRVKFRPKPEKGIKTKYIPKQKKD